MSWFSHQWNRFANQFDGDHDDAQAPITRIEVVWGRERFLVPINEKHPGQATLRDLKAIISQQTSIPYEQVKLISGGLILKDEKAPLSSYGIRSGSRLTLIGTQGGVPQRGDMPGAKASVMDDGGGAEGSGSGGHAHPMSKGEEIARRRKEREEDVSEQGLLSRIDETVTGVRTDLAPEVDEFEQHVQQGKLAAAATATAHETNGAGAAAPTPPTLDAVTKQQRKLSEFLLRALLALDGIHVNSDETRKRRKEAVKEVQGLLDRVDAAWTKIKANQSA